MQLLNVYNRFSHGIKVVLCFACTFLLVMALLLAVSASHYKSQTAESIQLVNDKLDHIKANFQPFLAPEYKDQNCQAFLQALRQSVFSTYMVKEAAVFKDNKQFFCSTTQGDVSFVLFDYAFLECGRFNSLRLSLSHYRSTPLSVTIQSILYYHLVINLLVNLIDYTNYLHIIRL